MEKEYTNHPKNLWRGVRNLARVATKHLTTHELSTHGQHTFPKNHQIIFPPRPTHFDEELDLPVFSEFYGEMYPYKHDFDHKPDRDIRDDGLSNI